MLALYTFYFLLTYLLTTATMGFHPILGKLLIISHPSEGRRLSWTQSRWDLNHNLEVMSPIHYPLDHLHLLEPPHDHDSKTTELVKHYKDSNDE